MEVWGFVRAQYVRVGLGLRWPSLRLISQYHTNSTDTSHVSLIFLLLNGYYNNTRGVKYVSAYFRLFTVRSMAWRHELRGCYIRRRSVGVAQLADIIAEWRVSSKCSANTFLVCFDPAELYERPVHWRAQECVWGERRQLIAARFASTPQGKKWRLERVPCCWCCLCWRWHVLGREILQKSEEPTTSLRTPSWCVLSGPPPPTAHSRWQGTWASTTSARSVPLPPTRVFCSYIHGIYIRELPTSHLL